MKGKLRSKTKRCVITILANAFALGIAADGAFAKEAANESKPEGAITPAEWAARCKPRDEWDKPSPPFRIHGDTFYVGICGITALLVRIDGGHVLIDTGTEAGTKVAAANVKAIGADPRDIGLILYSHEHFDHPEFLAKENAQ